MPRMPRLLLSKSYYHIMTRGNNHQTLFKAADDYYYYLRLIARYKPEHPFDLYHYCLMPNHTHFLIRTDEATEFANFMKKLNLAYFHYFQQHFGWTGHLWQDRYKSQPVGKDDYFIQCGKYIELNPVRAKLVKKAEDYGYSSAAYYMSSQKNSLLTEDFIYSELSQSAEERQAEYRKMTVSDLVKTSYKQPVWGSPNQTHNEQTKIDYHIHQ